MSMDFHLKQWRNQHESEEAPSGKMPRLLLDQQPSGSALPLFVPEPNSKISNLSAFPDSTTTATRFSKQLRKLGSRYGKVSGFLVSRHMLAGAAVPPELLQLIKKSLLNPPPYYLQHPLQHYQHYQPALLQSGYWGRAAMDPEPGRCRRTDGKKWRCSRDVVTGQKYCERHMHRGRNRSRKPVEIPTPAAAGGGGGAAAAVASVGALKSTTAAIAVQPLTTVAGGTHFALSGPPPSIDLLHLNRSPPEPKTENKGLFEHQTENVSGDGRSDGRVLRHFFDDWPRSIQEPDNATNGSNNRQATSSTYLSMSILGHHSSDVSLKLSTGNGDEQSPQDVNAERERPQLNWAAGWGTHQSAQMGGPLAEALRSATSNSSPTSVLHQLPRATASDTSYVST
ncbi:growth-regulating factor 3 isoform X2 [Vitis riparia]|uniref:growth-regulating factor 3 isoform X2 n=1 Tax=Vitis riparia TaxID=96939 RepID=UPI00155A6372|nr:growth-regulating factor 3 isoform X2 [Vitis riparia]